MWRPQEQHVAPEIAGYWERAEFPHHLVAPLAKLNLGTQPAARLCAVQHARRAETPGPAGGGVLQGNGCPGQSIMGAAIANVEMARVDGSMSTFLMVHNSLTMLTIGAALLPITRLTAAS